MMKNRLLFLVLAFFGTLNIAFAQHPVLAKYVIITFQETYKYSQDG